MSNSKTKGFTIVELLIVIVVVAILAAISIVAYNGIQNRASNDKTITAVNAWIKIFQIYKVDKGNYPLSDAGCLGSSANDFTAGSGFSANECQKFVGPLNYSRSYSSLLRDDLQTAIGTTVTLPSTTLDLVSGSNSNYTVNARGIFYQPYGITYFLKGKSAACGPGNEIAINAANTITQCYYELP